MNHSSPKVHLTCRSLSLPGTKHKSNTLLGNKWDFHQPKQHFYLCTLLLLFLCFLFLPSYQCNFTFFTQITTLVMKLPGYSMKQQFKGAQILLCFFFSFFSTIHTLSSFLRKITCGYTQNPGYFFT